MGWIEKYGTDIKRVRNMFVDYGLQQPLFETIPGGFSVTVFAENNSVVDSVVSDVTDNVTENEHLVLNLISKKTLTHLKN